MTCPNSYPQQDMDGGTYHPQPSAADVAAYEAEQHAALPRNWVISYQVTDRDENGNSHTFVYGWDADQCTFTRLREWWTVYPDHADAEEEYTARDMARWHQAAEIVQAERVY